MLKQKISYQKCQKLADELADEVLLEPAIYDAFATTQREFFVPSGMEHLAYRLDALPLSANQWISSPLTVAKMSVALEPVGVDSVLEVGCGSGYQAAILSKIVRRVFTIERIEKLLNEAKATFLKLELSNIHTRFDDGQKGWKTYAPYDRILFSASASSIPKSLFAQLKEGGILVAPLQKDRKQIITKFTKQNGTIQEEIIDECLFVPIKDGVLR